MQTTTRNAQESENQLALADFAGMTPDVVREKLRQDFEISYEVLEPYQILVAYMSEGSWGCDSSAWLLLRNRTSGELFEINASHCSCYGFEGQWSPEPTTREYLESDHYSFGYGGYDDDHEKHWAMIKEFFKANL